MPQRPPSVRGIRDVIGSSTISCFKIRDNSMWDALKDKAKTLGLNVPAFDECLDSGKAREALKFDERTAEQLALSTTPTSFVNGRIYRGGADRGTPLVHHRGRIAPWFRQFPRETDGGAAREAVRLNNRVLSGCPAEAALASRSPQFRSPSPFASPRTRFPNLPDGSAGIVLPWHTMGCPLPSSIQRQSGTNSNAIQVLSPSAPARCAVAVSAVMIKSMQFMIAAVSTNASGPESSWSPKLSQFISDGRSSACVKSQLLCRSNKRTPGILETDRRELGAKHRPLLKGPVFQRTPILNPRSPIRRVHRSIRSGSAVR